MALHAKLLVHVEPVQMGIENSRRARAAVPLVESSVRMGETLQVEYFMKGTLILSRVHHLMDDLLNNQVPPRVARIGGGSGRRNIERIQEISRHG